jgi:hypothetical protein
MSRNVQTHKNLHKNLLKKPKSRLSLKLLLHLRGKKNFKICKIEEGIQTRLKSLGQVFLSQKKKKLKKKKMKKVVLLTLRY